MTLDELHALARVHRVTVPGSNELPMMIDLSLLQGLVDIALAARAAGVALTEIAALEADLTSHRRPPQGWGRRTSRTEQ